MSRWPTLDDTAAAALELEAAARPPMVICDLTQFYSPVSGGVKRYLQEKKAFLRRRRPECRHILVVPGPENTRHVDGRATVYEVRSPLLNKTSRYRLLVDYARVRAIVREEQPDLIESGDPYQLAWQAIELGRELEIPVVGFYHSHFPEAYLRTMEKYAGKLAARLFMEAAKRYAKRLYNHFDATMVASPALVSVLDSWGVRHLRQVDLGVNTAVFKPLEGDVTALRRQLNLPLDRRVLLYVGRLAQEKNVRRLFEAWRLLQRETPDEFHLVLVGDGVMRGEVEALRDDCPPLTWIPYCEESERLAQIYQAADILVHPGLQETFGLVTLEAQACATPVVGIRGSYMDRIIFNDQAHWADADTPAALAAAIRRVSALDLPALGRQASAAVLERYSWDSICGRILAIYEEAIRVHGRAHA
jgi:alpha-1,6-mannosyltransferase